LSANEAGDRARIRYVGDAYGVDGQDPRLYQLMTDRKPEART
jgi:hypothetical protein